MNLLSKVRIRKLDPSLFIRASESKNVWIDGNDEASEGDFIFTDGSQGNKNNLFDVF